MKVRNALGMVLSGTIGKSIVASSWKGIPYIKAYAKPSNPRSKRQVKVRKDFRAALDAWRALDACQKRFYDRIARGISGFNLFVLRYMRAAKSRQTLELPLIIRWRTEDGLPVEEGMLVVRKGGRQLFADSLEETEGEIALTPSDTPYTFVLKRRQARESALDVDDLQEMGRSFALLGRRLGIRLILDIAPSPGTEDCPE